MKTLSLDYLILISQTKIDESFPTSQFNVEGYEIRATITQKNSGTISLSLLINVADC